MCVDGQFVDDIVCIMPKEQSPSNKAKYALLIFLTI